MILLKNRIFTACSMLLLSVCAIPTYAQEASKNLTFKQGWYLGLNAGAGFGSSAVNTSLDCSLQSYLRPSWCFIANQVGAGTVNINAFTGGLLGGYNWTKDHYLVGWELDFNSLNVNNTRSVSNPYNPDVPNEAILTIINQIKTNWLGTFRYRFGFTFDNILLYSTVGLAVTQLSHNTVYADPDDPGSVYVTNNAKSTKVGWTAGGGIEWLFAEKWSFKAEYLFINFPELLSSSERLYIIPGEPSLDTYDIFNFSANLQLNIIRAGIIYHF
jgi:outer membrane immunogenic protein